MDLPDRKCVELDANQAVGIGYQVFSTRAYAPSITFPAVTRAERIVIHHDPSGHMVRVKLAGGWHEYVNHPYTVHPSQYYAAPTAKMANPYEAGSPVFLITNNTEPNRTITAGAGLSFTKP